jgi:ribosomal protein S6
MHAHGGWVSETAMGLIRPTWRCEEIDGESETAKGLIQSDLAAVGGAETEGRRRWPGRR